MAFARFAYDRSGSIIVCVDQAELLAYSGSDEHPMWRQTCEAPLAAVGTTVGEVVAVDTAGRMHRFEANSGSKLDGVGLGGPARALAVARDGTCAALLEDRIVMVAGGKSSKELAAPGATCVAISDEGSAAAIGTRQGRVQVLDLRAGTEMGSFELGHEVQSICWNVRGFWLGTAGDQLWRIDAAGRLGASLAKLPGLQPHLTSSADGGLVACRTGAGQVSVVTLPQGETVATLGYQRSIEGIAFGPDVWLGIGLDKGDGNKINLITGACHRTDTHPGRAHDSWEVAIQIDKQKVKDGRSTANPSAEAVRAKIAAKNAAPPAGTGRLSLRYVGGLIVVAVVLVGGAFLAHSCR